MKRATPLFTIVVVLALGACGQQRDAAPAVSTVAASGSITPEQLGALGARIRKEPARGDELLEQHGLTRESFEKAIRDVTENADASRRYAEAYRKASA
jgi:hypothetical protein